MRICRLGTAATAISRYLDLLESPEVEALILLASQSDPWPEQLEEACALSREPDGCLSKLEVRRFAVPGPVSEAARRLWRDPDDEAAQDRAREAVESHPFSDFERAVAALRPDVVWSGSNDFDGSNFLAWWAMEACPSVPFVRSNKEHRCRYRLEERETILRSSALVLPSPSHLAAFETTYVEALGTRTTFADEYWRYSGIGEYLASRCFEKLSQFDGTPHIGIMSGRVTYGSTDSRANSRFNYVSIVEELLEAGAHVHLHTNAVYESVDVPVCSPENPYFMLAARWDRFHLEAPIDLDGAWENYAILGRYDAGVLHNVVPGEDVSAFSRINIPTRLFDYQLAGVLPIAVRGTLPEAEALIVASGFGVVCESYGEAVTGLSLGEASTRPQVPTFRDFASALLTACEAARLGQTN